MARAPAVQEIEELPEARPARRLPASARHAAPLRPRGRRAHARRRVRSGAHAPRAGSSPAPKASARRRSPTASRASCWRRGGADRQARHSRRRSRHAPRRGRCARCRIRACSSSAAPTTTKAKRFPATISVDEVRRLKTFLGRTAEAGRLARRHRRSRRRAQHHRRQRASEIARGAAAAHGLPARLGSPGAAA